MEHPAIFSATLGLSKPWQVTEVVISKEEKRMDITVDFINGPTCTCPTCGKEGKICATEKETWHHSNFFQHAAYLHAQVPRIECACCGKKIVDRPWTRAGSKFTLIL